MRSLFFFVKNLFIFVKSLFIFVKSLFIFVRSLFIFVRSLFIFLWGLQNCAAIPLPYKRGERVRLQSNRVSVFVQFLKIFVQISHYCGSSYTTYTTSYTTQTLDIKSFMRKCRQCRQFLKIIFFKNQLPPPLESSEASVRAPEPPLLEPLEPLPVLATGRLMVTHTSSKSPLVLRS